MDDIFENIMIDYSDSGVKEISNVINIIESKGIYSSEFVDRVVTKYFEIKNNIDNEKYKKYRNMTPQEIIEEVIKEILLQQESLNVVINDEMDIEKQFSYDNNENEEEYKNIRLRRR